ncbi:MAG: hypothetical protein ACK5Y2_11890 [Bdellovibrionales bacterium]
MRGRLFILGVSLVSMVLQPVAYGQQQANWAAEALRVFVQQNQKGGKPLTVKEFWERQRGQIDPYWQRKLAPPMKLMGNEPMPKMDVITIKGPQGQDSARLMMNVNGKTVSMEYLGGKEKFARINSVVISEQDFYGVEGMMEKLQDDPVFAAESKRVEQKALRADIMPSYEAYKSMTPKERAVYFVNLRLVVEAAQKVLDEKREKEQASSFSVPYVEWLLEVAHAQRNVKGDPCIVQGYVGVWTGKNKNDKYCSQEMGMIHAQNSNVKQTRVQQTISSLCPKGQSPCNPFIYGFPAGGSCIAYENTRGRPQTDFQRATSVCDSRMPLRQSNPALLAKDSQQMVASLLAAGEDKSAIADKIRTYFTADGRVVSKEKYDEIKNTVVADFYQFIDAGIATCDLTSDGRGTPDPNQGSACQVLRTRRLAFQSYIEQLKFVEDPKGPTPPIVGETKPPCKEGEKEHEGKCVPTAVPPVAQTPTPGEDDCKARGLEPSRNDGKIECVPVAAALPTDRRVAGREDRRRGSAFPWLAAGLTAGIFIGLIALIRRGSKAKPGGPIPAQPVAPVPLPPAPPPPGPAVPPPPPLTPPPQPNLPSETGPTPPPPFNPGGGGTR